MKLIVCLKLLIGPVAVGFVLLSSNIDPAHKFSWDENSGWMNWLDADGGASGVVVASDHLSGYIWSENNGWINVGNGGGPYTNADDTNFGVNIRDDGDLEGFGWGENIGWVNFETSSVAPDQARFDSVIGRFRGFAWGENGGWINLDDTTHFVATIGAGDIPTVSQWGMLTMALLIMIAGTLVCMRRRTNGAGAF